jgi:hypothetical protein
MDSDDADAENQSDDGNTLLFVFERGYSAFLIACVVPVPLFYHILAVSNKEGYVILK